MTNREKLTKTNIYDLLCRMQRSAFFADSELSGLCVIENITGCERPCPGEDSFGYVCPECIARWLGEEARG